MGGQPAQWLIHMGELLKAQWGLWLPRFTQPVATLHGRAPILPPSFTQPPMVLCFQHFAKVPCSSGAAQPGSSNEQLVPMMRFAHTHEYISVLPWYTPGCYTHMCNIVYAQHSI